MVLFHPTALVQGCSGKDAQSSVGFSPEVMVVIVTAMCEFPGCFSASRPDEMLGA
jgi:hypothetical protein